MIVLTHNPQANWSDSVKKISKAYLEKIREALREQANWRWTTQKRNQKECDWVKEILNASSSNKIQVDGHFKSKVERQQQWLERHRETLGDGFIAQVEELHENVLVDGEDVCSVM